MDANIRNTPSVGVITLPERGGPSKGGGGSSTTYTFTGAGVVLATGTTHQTVTVSDGVLDQTATDITVGNTAAETTIYSKSITGGTLGSIGMLRLTLMLRAKTEDNGSGDPAASFTLRFKYGSTTLITVANSSAGVIPSYVESIPVFYLLGDTATNIQLGKFGAARGTAAEDSTAAKTLAVTLQWSSAAGANQSAVMEHATLEVVK